MKVASNTAHKSAETHTNSPNFRLVRATKAKPTHAATLAIKPILGWISKSVCVTAHVLACVYACVCVHVCMCV